MTRPRLLDLFCGAGGAAMGYPTPDPDPLGSCETEQAWAAGFFDGEGYVGVRRDKRPGRTLTLQIGIEQVDPRPLARFKEAVGWGGNIVLRPARRAPNRQPIYRIIMGHADTLHTFTVLWQWLSEPKREQFLRAAREVGVDPSEIA